MGRKGWCNHQDSCEVSVQVVWRSQTLRESGHASLVCKSQLCTDYCASQQLCTDYCASHNFVQTIVQVTTLYNDVSCSMPLLALIGAEVNRVTVTHIRSVTPSKRKMKARSAFLLVPFDWKPIYVETAACSDAQYLSPFLLLQFQRVEQIAIMSVACRTLKLSEKSQNGTVLIAQINLLSALK